MADDEIRCVVCRRTSDAVGDICLECQVHIELPSSVFEEDDRERAVTIVRLAARRAWEFADALLDVAPRRAPGGGGYRPGDPGPSRWKPGRRRR